VARAIFASAIPVVSAVGHEPDFTIADFAADVRAATPSHAAEIVAPDCEEWIARIKEAKKKLSAERFFSDKRQQLDRFGERLRSAWDRNNQPRGRSIAALAARLDALSPLKVLARGYAVAQGPDGVPLRSVKNVGKGGTLTVRLSDGLIKSQVEEIING
jgi:exodeoxyribonuclease VII large subunit